MRVTALNTRLGPGLSDGNAAGLPPLSSLRSGDERKAEVVLVDRERAVIGSANLGVLIEGPEAWEIGGLPDRLAEAAGGPHGF